ncbi:MAG: hypothetical protein G01um101493_333 [Microgenomates group bacterium Gr01-1014_93]|nr:MAG: hypothetical protein G01um101493_333 [Microgenomates group bacterium Gr01-1014_93]
MEATLEERVEGRRSPTDIVIEILEFLRENPKGVRQNQIVYMVYLSSAQGTRYSEYLHGKGLIEVTQEPRGKRITATPKGFQIGLIEENFRDVSRRRTKAQLYEDIAYAIYRNGKNESRSSIFRDAGLSWKMRVRCIAEMESAGDLELNANGKYQLTEAGKAKYQDPGTRVRKRPTYSSPGECLARILEEASDGITRNQINSKRLPSPTYSGPWCIEFLLTHGLLSKAESGSTRAKTFYSTEFYQSLDKEALPYALDAIIWEDRLDSGSNTRRTAQLIQLDILEKASEPHTIRYFIGIVTSDNLTYKKHIAQLQQKGYLEPVQQGRYTFYQRAPKGTEFLESAATTVNQIRAVEQIRKAA